MARFDTSGLDDVFAQMQNLGEAAGEVADEMLISSAEIVKQAWKRAAQIHGHKRTGGMIESIGYPKKPKAIKGLRSIDIYPIGNTPGRKEKDGSPLRYAATAFRLHYGTSKHPGSHWIDTADRLSEKPVEENMQKMWEDHLKKKGLI